MPKGVYERTKPIWNKDKRFPDKLKENHPNWKGGTKVANHRHKTRRRQEMLEYLGAECIKCGYSDFRALQIDHINAGGRKEFKEIGMTGIYKRVVENPEEYQLLCANCNWIKRYENKEWRKENEY